MNGIHNDQALRRTSSVRRSRAQTRSQKVNRNARLVIEANCTRCRRMRGACKIRGQQQGALPIMRLEPGTWSY